MDYEADPPPPYRSYDDEQTPLLILRFYEPTKKPSRKVKIAGLALLLASLVSTAIFLVARNASPPRVEEPEKAVRIAIIGNCLFHFSTYLPRMQKVRIRC